MSDIKNPVIGAINNAPSDDKVNLLSLFPSELAELCLSVGEPKFRAKQLFAGMHKGLAPEEISNVGKSAAAKLYAVSYFYLPTPEKKLVSKIDGTIKYLFRMRDGNCVESVVMKYEHGYTICISSQVGCRMGCAFCASTIGGLVRSLEPDELAGQVIAAEKDMNIGCKDVASQKRISNIVLMGIGEPLDNYNNVIKFLKIINQPGGLNIGYRHISLSTCGLADRILRLADEELPITLSISLHAYDNEKRSEIMPVNKKWNIDELLGACAVYYAKTSRRISFEYTLIHGVNDTREGAAALAKLLNSHLRDGNVNMPIHVNLIPVNPVESTGFTAATKKDIEVFVAVLGRYGINATVRRHLGADINASCGQLRRQTLTEENAKNKK